ncbi:hypothetical protein PR202_gb15441 [Eleusine coracana subsp. coracana]|uniref:WRKY domain-containing protein n=1 Tax=Eleusine coracana subsp. coracana TaxID=191504 RepID=A0AAV5EY04_ELECO|nr:hypothetical protein PR202_gb15441 [Eleusine coracana subsp. coracana]
MASKLVQQVNNDDPPLYEVTYMHGHTCKAEHIPPSPDIDVMDAAGPPDASDGFVLSFGSSSGGRGGHRDTLMMPEVRQPVPPSPFTTTCFFGSSPSSSNSQIMHENPDFFHLNDDVPLAAALWSPVESWPSTTSSDEGDLFSAWDTFNGFGFDNHAPYPVSNSTPCLLYPCEHFRFQCEEFAGDKEDNSTYATPASAMATSSSKKRHICHSGGGHEEKAVVEKDAGVDATAVVLEQVADEYVEGSAAHTSNNGSHDSKEDSAEEDDYSELRSCSWT